MTVTGTARVSSKSWVIPSFSPRIPLTSGIVATPSLQLDLDVHARGQLQPLQLLHRLGGGVVDVDEPLVREHLEVLAAVLVLVRRADHGVDGPLGGQRHRPDHPRARPGDMRHDVPDGGVQDLVVVGPQLDPDLRRRHLVSYLSILVTRPAPTVRPPSRMANRRPSSMAMGAMSSTSISVLSPGMTISTPSASLME